MLNDVYNGSVAEAFWNAVEIGAVLASGVNSVAGGAILLEETFAAGRISFSRVHGLRPGGCGRSGLLRRSRRNASSA